MIATSGEPRICATAAWLRPISDTTISTAAMVSGMLAMRGQPLANEVLGAGFRRAVAAHAAERRAHAHGRLANPFTAASHRSPPISSPPTIHRMTVSAIEPTRLARASHSRSAGPKPWPVSQIRWRTPPSM